jgi:hypothetical protein
MAKPKRKVYHVTPSPKRRGIVKCNKLQAHSLLGPTRDDAHDQEGANSESRKGEYSGAESVHRRTVWFRHVGQRLSIYFSLPTTSWPVELFATEPEKGDQNNMF